MGLGMPHGLTLEGHQDLLQGLLYKGGCFPIIWMVRADGDCYRMGHLIRLQLTLTGDALKRLVYVKEESLSQINSFVFICSIFA